MMLKSKLWYAVFIMAVLLANLPGNQTEAQGTELLPLPNEAYDRDGNLYQGASLNSVPNQVLVTATSEAVSLPITFNVYGSRSQSERIQLFLIFSWTPDWPPQAGYYVRLYDGFPGAFPGKTQTQTVSLTAPPNPGTYYMWFCAEAESYSQIYGAETITRFSRPLPMPAHLKVIVMAGNRVGFLAVNTDCGRSAAENIANAASKDKLVTVGTEFYPPHTTEFKTPITKLLSGKPGIIWAVCAPEEKNVIEQEARQVGFKGEMRYYERKYIDFDISDPDWSKSPPFGRGDTIHLWLSVKNLGWLPLNSAVVEFKISDPDGKKVFSDIKETIGIDCDYPSVLETSWTIPQTAKTGDYSLLSKVTCYEGPSKSGNSYQQEKVSSFTVNSAKETSIALPLIFGLAFVGVIAVLIATIGHNKPRRISRRKSPRR